MVALDHYTRGEGGGGRWQASGSNRPLHEGEGGGGRWQASGCVRPLHEGGGRGREVAG